MPADFNQLWESKYLPRWRAQVEREGEARDRAFLDVSCYVCGEPIRQLTARDMFILQGLENPFVYGGPITPAHIAQFLWCQHTQNNPERQIRSAYLRGRMIGRVAKRGYVEAITEINTFVDDMTLDLGGGRGGGSNGQERAPLLVCMLAPLLVVLSRGMKSSMDPATGLPFIESPLPRLLQYRKTIEAIEAGKDFRESPPSTIHLVECADEVNRINAEESAAAANEERN